MINYIETPECKSEPVSFMEILIYGRLAFSFTSELLHDIFSATNLGMAVVDFHSICIKVL